MFYFEKMRIRVVKMLKKMQMFWRVPCFGCALHQLAIKVIYLTLRPPPNAIQCKTLMPDEAKRKMRCKEERFAETVVFPVPPSSQLHSLPPTTTIIVAILIQTDMVL